MSRLIFDPFKQSRLTPEQAERSRLIQAEHDKAHERAVTTGRYVILNGLLQCPSGVSLAMPWYVPEMEAEVLKIVELLGGEIWPSFDPEGAEVRS